MKNLGSRLLVLIRESNERQRDGNEQRDENNHNQRKRHKRNRHKQTLGDDGTSPQPFYEGAGRLRTPISTRERSTYSLPPQRRAVPREERHTPTLVLDGAPLVTVGA